MKQNDKAEAWLRRALKAEPDNAAANFNLGLLLAETDRLDEAEKALRAALKSDPQLAPAAYNLAVILGEKKDLAGAVQWCRKAHDLRPEELKYTESLVFYLNEKGDKDEAIAVLKKAIEREPAVLRRLSHSGRHLRESWRAEGGGPRVRDAMQEQPEFPPAIARGVAEARRGAGEIDRALLAQRPGLAAGPMLPNSHAATFPHGRILAFEQFHKNREHVAVSPSFAKAPAAHCRTSKERHWGSRGFVGQQGLGGSHAAARAMGQMGPDARAVAPALGALRNCGHWQVRKAAVEALEIDPET